MNRKLAALGIGGILFLAGLLGGRGESSGTSPSTAVPGATPAPVASPAPSPSPAIFVIPTPAASPSVTAQPTPAVRRTVAPPVSVPDSCGAGTYRNVDGDCVRRPVVSSTVPAGATARCQDGTYSFSQHRRGTCSHHGGVAEWL